MNHEWKGFADQSSASFFTFCTATGFKNQRRQLIVQFPHWFLSVKHYHHLQMFAILGGGIGQKAVRCSIQYDCSLYWWQEINNTAGPSGFRPRFTPSRWLEIGFQPLTSADDGCWPAMAAVCGVMGGGRHPRISRSRRRTQMQDKNCFVVLIWISMVLFLHLLSWPCGAHKNEKIRVQVLKRWQWTGQSHCD